MRQNAVQMQLSEMPRNTRQQIAMQCNEMHSNAVKCIPMQ